MSYCRYEKGKSDLYVFGNGYGWECCSCRLRPERITTPKKVWEMFKGMAEEVGMPPPPRTYNGFKSVVYKTRQEMLRHLMEHRKMGHKVPQHAIDRLKKEIKQENNERFIRKSNKK